MPPPPETALILICLGPDKRLEKHPGILPISHFPLMNDHLALLYLRVKPLQVHSRHCPRWWLKALLNIKAAVGRSHRISHPDDQFSKIMAGEKPDERFRRPFDATHHMFLILDAAL